MTEKGINMKKTAILLAATIIFTIPVTAKENIQRYTLQNGHNVIIKEVRTNPSVMIDTWFSTGSTDETASNNGIAHFLEHLFFKGSKNYPGNAFSEITDAKGAITNAATSKDFTHYYILLPSKEFLTATDLHADMLNNPLFPGDEIERERNVVIREIDRTLDSPQRALYSNLSRAFYPTDAYGRDVIGTKEIISGVPRSEIVGFYEQNYYPGRMTTVIVGDVDAKTALNAVKERFGAKSGAKCAQKLNKPVVADKIPTSQVRVSETKDINTAYILLGFRTTPDNSSADAYALDIAATLLGNGKSSMLYEDLKENKGLVKSIYANSVPYARDGLFVIGADLNPHNISAAENEIFKNIDRLQNLDEKSLERGKKIILTDTLFGRETVENIASELGYLAVVSKDKFAYENYTANINNVTLADVKKAAGKYLKRENSVISMVLPKKEIKTEKFKTCEPSAKIEQKPIFKVPCAKPAKFTKLKNTDKYTLKSGATLLCQKNKDNEIIAVKIIVKGGKYTETVKGTDEVLAEVLTDGTTKYPGKNFAAISEENGISIDAGAGTETFTISMKCTKSDLPLALDMLREVVKNPQIGENSVNKAKSDLMHQISKSRDIPSNVAFEAVKYEMRKGTPYDTTGKTLEQQIPKINQKDVKARFDELFCPQNVTIAINGNIDNQTAINAFSEMFDKKCNCPNFDYKNFKNLFYPVKKDVKITQQSGFEAAWVIKAWDTAGKTDLKDRMTLNVINSILGSGMSSRLFVEIREKNALAYATGSGFSAGVNRGMFYTYTSCAPQNTEKTLIATDSEIKRIMTEPVCDEELKNAKSKLLGNYILSAETNLQKASMCAGDENDGDGCEFSRKVPELINSVTKEDILRVAQKYFSQPSVTVILTNDKK